MSIQVDTMRKLWGNSPAGKNRDVELLINQEMTYYPVIQLILQSSPKRMFVLKKEVFKEGDLIWLTVNSDYLEALISVAKEKIYMLYELSRRG